MIKHCLVISGEWNRGANNVWDFKVDKEQMTRVVPVEERISLKVLKERILNEFFVDGGESKTVHLSYWPPNSNELATGIETPPVVVANDGGIAFFFQHLRVNPSTNLFVKFEDAIKSVSGSASVGKPWGYTTPLNHVSKPVHVDDQFLERPKIYTSTIEPNDVHGSVDSNVRKRKSLPCGRLFTSGGSEDEEKSDYPGVVDDVWGAVSEIDVRPRGYNSEFWDPVIEEMYAGPDNLDFGEGDVQNSGEGFIYKCSSGSAFDHDVFASGSMKAEGRVRKPGPVPSFDVHIDEAWTRGPGMNTECNAKKWGSGIDLNASASASTDLPSSSPAEVTEESIKRDSWVRGHPSVDVQRDVRKRELSAVAAEEFDIPPLYDDLSYEVPEFPDLDHDDGDDDIYVGKVFGSKKDCQIALAIYAIKNQFSFFTKANEKTLLCAELCGYSL